MNQAKSEKKSIADEADPSTRSYEDDAKQKISKTTSRHGRSQFGKEEPEKSLLSNEANSANIQISQARQLCLGI